MRKLEKLLKGIIVGYTTFYGTPSEAAIGDMRVSNNDSDDLSNITRLDEKIATPEHILQLPDRAESGLFASHRSHRSHSSHRSHYSSASGSRGSSGSGSGAAIIAVAVGAAYYFGRKNRK